MFQDEARYKFDHYIHLSDLNQEQNRVASIYVDQRASLVDRIFTMGLKFK